jgi:sensor histidine kinase YesM
MKVGNLIAVPKTLEYYCSDMKKSAESRLWRSLFIPIFLMNLLLLPSLFILVKRHFSLELVPFSLINSIIMTAGLMLNLFVHNQLSGRTRKLTIYLLMAISSVGFSISGLLYVLVNHPLLLLYGWEVMVSYIMIIFVIMMALSLFGCGFFNYQKMIDKESEEKQKERQLREEMERKMYTSKINPHFLFNSLNLMVSLLDDKEKAEDVLIGLSELLRFNLDASKKKQIPLVDEINNTKRYLFIQKQRFQERLDYEISGTSHRNIPPLLLQPLVENSIKHNLDTCDYIKITITTEESEQHLKITVRDSMALVTEEMIGAGTGLEVTKKRVQLAGGDFAIVNGGIQLCLPAK